MWDRWLDGVQLAVSGGTLDHSTEIDALREMGGSELLILLLNSAGKVSLSGLAGRSPNYRNRAGLGSSLWLRGEKLYIRL